MIQLLIYLIMSQSTSISVMAIKILQPLQQHFNDFIKETNSNYNALPRVLIFKNLQTV
jgi:hypothetical protein